MNNTKFVSTVLMHSNLVGPMAELIVINAIEDYTKRVVEAGEEEVKKQMERTMINGSAWFRGCKEIHEKLKARK